MKVFVAAVMVTAVFVLGYLYYLDECRSPYFNASAPYFHYTGVVLLVFVCMDVILLADSRQLSFPVFDAPTVLVLCALLAHAVMDISRYEERRPTRPSLPVDPGVHPTPGHQECLLRREGEVLSLLPSGTPMERPEDLQLPVPKQSAVSRSVIRARVLYEPSAKRIVLGRIPADKNVIYKIILEGKDSKQYAFSFFNREKTPIAVVDEVIKMPVQQPGIIKGPGASAPELHYAFHPDGIQIAENKRLDVYGFYVSEIQGYVVPILVSGDATEVVAMELGDNKFLSLSTRELVPEKSLVTVVEFPPNRHVDLVHSEGSDILTTLVVSDEQV